MRPLVPSRVPFPGTRFFLCRCSTTIVHVESSETRSWYRVRQFVTAHWLTLAFVAGFISDFILLNRIDDVFDNVILLLYVVLATVSLVLFYVSVAQRGPAWLVRFLSWSAPVAMQYAFGGLLSGMLIFYGRSSDLIVGAPFLLLIVAVIIANELIKKRSDRLLYNVSLYFVGVFSYTVLIVPVWTGKMGEWVFVMSGFLALLVTMFLIKILKYVVPNYLVLQKRMLVFTIGCLYVFFNTLYFLNLIPPIPLSLNRIDIYQSVEKIEGGYRITREARNWLERLPWYPITFHPSGSGVSCFAQVYAPTSIAKTQIFHRWEMKTAAGVWVERSRIGYTIESGSEAGYRGYTTITNISPGSWRCTVMNERGQVLGRRTFTIDTSIGPESLVTVLE